MVVIRIRRLFALLALSFAIVVLRVGQLATLERARTLSDRGDAVRTEWIPVRRAPIVARGRDGRDVVLARDVPAHDVTFTIEGVDPIDVALREIEAALAAPDADPPAARELRGIALAGLPLPIASEVRTGLPAAVRDLEDRLARLAGTSRAWAEAEIDRAAGPPRPDATAASMRARLVRPGPEDRDLRARIPGGTWIDPVALWGDRGLALLHLPPGEGRRRLRRRIEEAAGDPADPIAVRLRAAWRARDRGLAWRAWLTWALDEELAIRASVRILTGIPPGRLQAIRALLRDYPRTFSGLRIAAVRERPGLLGRLFPRTRYDLWCDPRDLGRRVRLIRLLEARLPAGDVEAALGDRAWGERLDAIWAGAAAHEARARAERVASGDPRARARRAARRKYRAYLDYRLRQKRWRLARAIGPDLVTAIAYEPDRYPGLRVESRLRRAYLARAPGRPPGEITAPLVGIADLPTEAPRRGEAPPALEGRSGLEARYDERLRGRPGWRRYRAGRLAAEAPPLPAPPLRLWLDLDLQRAACQALERAVEPFRHRKGSIVVMDLETGGILACASTPSFDPNAYLARDPAAFRRLEALRAASPLANHALRAYRPGSVFKLFVAAAALGAGVIAPGTPHFCAGKQSEENRCNNHGAALTLDLYGAIQRSCNAYFIWVGSALGRERILRALPAFGFYRPEGTGIDLPEPPRSIARARDLNPTFFSFGEGKALVTPLEILRLVAAIALDGRAPVPRVAAEGDPHFERFPIRAAHARVLRDAMRRVVARPGGTAHGREIGLDAFSVAAKTGTAEIRHQGAPPTNNAWIAGFAPRGAPRFAFIVCLEDVDDGHHGGRTAGPVAAEILRRLAAAGHPELLGEEGP